MIWCLKPGSRPGRHLTTKSFQHSKYVVSWSVLRGHSCSCFFTFWRGKFRKPKYKDEMLEIPAQNGSSHGVAGLADGNRGVWETPLPLKNQKAAGHAYRTVLPASRRYCFLHSTVIISFYFNRQEESIACVLGFAWVDPCGSGDGGQCAACTQLPTPALIPSRKLCSLSGVCVSVSQVRGYCWKPSSTELCRGWPRLALLPTRSTHGIKNSYCVCDPF